MNKGELIAADPYLAENTYDTALPQTWVDDVHRVTGVYPAALFVWIYDKHARTFGRPYPLTPDAQALLARFQSNKEV